VLGEGGAEAELDGEDEAEVELERLGETVAEPDWLPVEEGEGLELVDTLVDADALAELLPLEEAVGEVVGAVEQEELGEGEEDAV
jgi:hypothetical protein